MSRSTVLLIALVVGAPIAIDNRHSSLAADAPVAWPPPWCLAETDSDAVEFKERLVGLATSSAQARVRQSLGVRAISPDSIVFVTDEAVCQRLSQVRDSIYASVPEVATQQPLAVATYGGDYATYAPGHYAGEWRVIQWYDTATFTTDKPVLLW